MNYILRDLTFILIGDIYRVPILVLIKSQNCTISSKVQMKNPLTFTQSRDYYKYLRTLTGAYLWV